MNVGLWYITRIVRYPGIGWRLIGLVALAVGGALLEGAGIGFLIPIFENLQNPAAGADTATPAAGFLALVFQFFGLRFSFLNILAGGMAMFCGNSILTYIRVMMTARTQDKFLVATRSKLFSTVLEFDLSFFHQSRIGGLVNTMTTEAYRSAQALRLMVDMVAAFCLLSIYAVVQFFVSWKLALITFPIVGLLAFLLRPRHTYEWGVKQTQENDNLQSIALETLGGIREVKALGIADLSQRQFERAAVALKDLDILLTRGAALFNLVYQVVVIAVVATMVYAASQWIGLPLPALLVFFLALQRMAPRVGNFTETRHWWLGAVASMEKVEGLMADAGGLKMSMVSGPVHFSVLENGIEFKDVHFRHKSRETEALSGISFFIPRGRMTAIVGTSGAGKSTLLDLLARFYDPASGGIDVDGRDLRELDLDSWRRSIGLVSQDTFLFNDSIESNIRYGLRNASREAIVAAAQKAYAHGFITELPEGYATVVGEKGVKLSGGQRQRIALSRAILREPQLLVLDEATSHLDSESEMYIQKAIREFLKTATVVIVAHRLSTVEKADSIVVLDGGRVADRGVHGELLGRGGRYAELYGIGKTDAAAI